MTAAEVDTAVLVAERKGSCCSEQKVTDPRCSQGGARRNV